MVLGPRQSGCVQHGRGLVIVAGEETPAQDDTSLCLSQQPTSNALDRPLGCCSALERHHDAPRCERGGAVSEPEHLTLRLVDWQVALFPAAPQRPPPLRPPTRPSSPPPPRQPLPRAQVGVNPADQNPVSPACCSIPAPVVVRRASCVVRACGEGARLRCGPWTLCSRAAVQPCRTQLLTSGLPACICPPYKSVTL